VRFESKGYAEGPAYDRALARTGIQIMNVSSPSSRAARAATSLGLLLALVAAGWSASPVRVGGQPVAGMPASAYQDLRWRSVGPHRGGRVTAIAGVRTQPCTFYQGATGGGVWKTTTCGHLWEPTGDGQIATGSIGAIAVSDSHPDIVYVGTGSAAMRSNVIIGRGMYRSADAGNSWQFIGLRDAGQIGSVIVHPTNPDVVWAAALGSPFGPNEERGIFKTTDGGKTWRKVLYVNSETGGRVVAINWSNPDELYAGMYRGFRKGWDIISGGPATEGGIYKSTDGGVTWAKLANGLPRTLVGKIDLDVARSRPSTVYAMVEAPGEEGGLYRSTDSGASWTLVNSEARLRARPFYFHYVDVNPKNENEVWVNELRLWKSGDGGKTWVAVDTPHGDNHGIWFNPDDPATFIQCNDGGANVTRDGGRTWSSIYNQPTGEFYMVAVDEQFPYRLYGPQQDNSTIILPSLPPSASSSDRPEQLWTQGPGCETGQIQPRPDGSVVWGVCKGEIGRYDTVTGQEQHYWVYPQNRYGHDPDDIRYRFPRQSVIAVSPHDPKVVYHASHVVHVTRDEGLTWEVISGDLTAREPDKQIVSGTPITRDVTGEEVYSSIYAMVESRLEKGVLWVGANDGPVHVSRDGGKTWRNVTPPGVPPGGRVQNIEDSPHRKGSAYIAVYRYLREHDLRPYIFRTDDYGTTWTRLTDGGNGIPVDHPTRVVREDTSVPGLLYAGTEFGAFVSFDNGARWQSLQQNLPATPVTDIRVHRGDLVVSTMGRGFWIMDDVTPLRGIAARLPAGTAAGTAGAAGGGSTGSRVAFSSERPEYLFEPRVAYRHRYAASARRADWPEYPPAGARIDYWLKEPADAVSLTIADGTGRVVRTITSDAPPSGASEGQGMRGARRGGAAATRLPARVGGNRVVWDLRHAGSPGGGEGPLVAPGRFEVRITVSRRGGTTTLSAPLEVRVDPRVAAAGVTQADLEEQADLLVRLRDAIGESRQLSGKLRTAREQAKDDAGRVATIDKVLARLVTASGPYPQPMLIDQFSNVARMLGQADQKPGKDAWDRYRDLARELDAVKAAAAGVL
jgi:photosystem II stability/assembly factor-like uncharacterized protein